MNVCLTAATGNRAESVNCKTYTISGLSASGAGNSHLLNRKNKMIFLDLVTLRKAIA